MKLRVLLPLVMIACTVHAGDFRRNLPDPKLIAQITPEKFTGSDAVIIIKEQVFNTHNATIHYGGLEFEGMSTTQSKNIIAKVLNEAGVTRYGSFEYEYFERFGDELPNGFGVRARTLKSDGTVWELPEDDVKTVVSRESADGVPLARKVMAKLPNLAVGDVVQIEYDFNEVLTRSTSGIFFLSDRDPVLFSNLALTLPAKDEIHYQCFPAERIGEPTVQQLSTDFGAGNTYFWSVKKTMGIPEEPFAPPFEEQSLLIAFQADIRKDNGYISKRDWNSIAKDFAEDYLDKDKVGDDEIRALGFQPGEPKVTLRIIDSLYAALRKTITLHRSNALYPLSTRVSSIFKKKRGDASDLSYIFSTILKQWGQKVDVVMLRDRREGPYEVLVPSTVWFDRLGTLVYCEGKERLYDFDRSVPEQYDMPWFLNGIQVPVISTSGCTHKIIVDQGTDVEHYIHETHLLNFSGPGSAHDSLVYACVGSAADRLRDRFYDAERNALTTGLQNLVIPDCFAKVETLACDRFGENPVLSVGYGGESIMKVEPLDAFLTLKLKNHALRHLRDQLFSTNRMSDVRLDEPFSMQVRWKAPFPEGYVFVSGPEARTIAGPGKASCTIAVDPGKSGVDISATLRFPVMAISRQDYNGLVGFLDSSLAALEKDVVFGKSSEPVRGTPATSSAPASGEGGKSKKAKK